MYRKISNEGWSLLEFSIVIIIISTLFYIFSSFANHFLQSHKESITKTNLVIIERKIVAHFKKYNVLPCPENSDSQCSNDLACNKIDKIYKGEIPIDALRLEESYKYDGWHRKIEYFVDKAILCNDKEVFYQNAGNIEIFDNNNNIISNKAVYALKSNGRYKSSDTRLIYSRIKSAKNDNYLKFSTKNLLLLESNIERTISSSNPYKNLGSLRIWYDSFNTENINFFNSFNNIYFNNLANNGLQNHILNNVSYSDFGKRKFSFLFRDSLLKTEDIKKDLKEYSIFMSFKKSEKDISILKELNSAGKICKNFSFSNGSICNQKIELMENNIIMIQYKDKNLSLNLNGQNISACNNIISSRCASRFLEISPQEKFEFYEFLFFNKKIEQDKIEEIQEYLKIKWLKDEFYHLQNNQTFTIKPRFIGKECLCPNSTTNPIRQIGKMHCL